MLIHSGTTARKTKTRQDAYPEGRAPAARGATMRSRSRDCPRFKKARTWQPPERFQPREQQHLDAMTNGDSATP
jgi:hypothetical protein